MEDSEQVTRTELFWAAFLLISIVRPDIVHLPHWFQVVVFLLIFFGEEVSMLVRALIGWPIVTVWDWFDDWRWRRARLRREADARAEEERHREWERVSHEELNPTPEMRWTASATITRKEDDREV